MPRELQQVLDAIPDAVLLLDAEGRVEQVNAEACRILEISDEAIRLSPVEQILGPEHPLAPQVREALASGRPSVIDEIRIERRLSDPVDVDIAVSPVDESDRSRSGVVVLMRDRTLWISLREQVTQQAELANYGRIAAGIAHEVKNPLGGIRGAGELLGTWAEDDRSRKAAAMIVREVDRIASLVDELMVFAHSEVVHDESLNLHYLLDGVLDLLTLDPLGEKISIERFYDPSIPEFLGDADRLTQVFLNLCRNALQAMEEQGGALTITTRMSLDRRLTGPDGQRAPAVIIAVSDTGDGISPALVDQLTTPFFTTRAEGTGLGLAVARHWVVHHGGTLRFTSQPGEGTTVRVALPLRRERQASRTKDSP